MPTDGTFAEYLAIDVDRLSIKPDYLSFEEAAALPIAGLTSYRIVFTKANIKPNENILITGIGGGVALQTLLFAKAIGANIYITSGDDKKIEKAISLGAINGFNYLDATFSMRLQEFDSFFDSIIDCAGGSNFNLFSSLCKMGGKIIFYGALNGLVPNLNLQSIYYKNLNLIGTMMGNDTEFKFMLEFMKEKKIRPVIDTIVSFEKIEDVFEKIKFHSQFGKIILKW